jgi:hypothetical protein
MMLKKTGTPDSIVFLRQSVPQPFPIFFFLLTTVLLSIVGCAKIADPQPPEILIPKAAVDLTASQRAGTVVLRVSIPLQNTNGSPVRTLQSVKVYRHASDTSKLKQFKPIPEDQFGREAVQILSIPKERIPDYRQADLLILEDSFSGLEQSLIYTHTFRYAVLFVNNKNQAAGFSNQVVITPVRMPPPPSGLTVEVTETSIHLKWEAPLENIDGSGPDQIAGYNLYRSTELGQISTNPVNSSPLKRPEFKDVHFHFDRTYYYRVSVIGGSREVPAESLLSAELAVTPRDVFPPQPAGNFSVLYEDDFNLLLWSPSPSTDVAGYKITRREEGTTTGQLLQQGLIPGNSYRDINIQPGKKYEYTLTAIDTFGNTSSAVHVAATPR